VYGRRIHSRGARFVVGISVVAVAWSMSAAAAPQVPPRADPVLEYSARARSAYERGDFREAAELYKKAQALRGDPTLLFNLGRCYEALATLPDLKESVESYEAYLRERGDSPDRAAVERRIDVLRQQIHLLEEQAQRALSPSPPIIAPVVAPAPAPPKHTPVPWVVAGLGAGGVLAGVVLGVLADGKRSAAVAESSGALASELEATGRSLATGANVAFVAGGSLAAAGVTWGIVDLAAFSKAPRPVAVSVGLGRLQLSGQF
jgi:hypothetical protein